MAVRLRGRVRQHLSVDGRAGAIAACLEAVQGRGNAAGAGRTTGAADRIIGSTGAKPMDPTLLSSLILILMFVLLFCGMPIGFAMGLSAFVGTLLLIDAQAALSLLGQTAYDTAVTYNLSVVPMFVLMGYIAGNARLSEALYRACNAWLGHRRGGLALATIGACGGFAAICGSSIATAATMAQIALPEMRRYNYDDRLATGAVAAGGTIGILIPPSIIMVIYGLLTETSISKLFLAGFLPGLL